MTDWPSDVAALADELRIDRFIVAGHSSGGPYALACAALLPDRVLAGITLGGVTDMRWSGAWEGYVESERELMRVPDEEGAIAWCVERFGEDGSGFMAASGLSFSEPDERLYGDEAIARYLAAVRPEAFRQGVSGYAQDILIQARAWPFDPGTIAVPVYILHGESDTVLPLAHSHYTASLIPGSTLRILPGHGHFTILAELPLIGSTLAPT
jgi:pimeloyl-ACP methyl ester carboxylesterase